MAGSKQDEIREQVRRLVVDEGRSEREAARILKCHRKTVGRVVAGLGENVRARRQALVLELAAKNVSIAAIAQAAGLTRRGVRYIIAAHETGRNPDHDSVPTVSAEERNARALAALDETETTRPRDVANDREGGARARNGRFVLNYALDHGPPAGRVVPEGDPDNDNEQSDEGPEALEAEARAEGLALAKVVTLHERDGLSAKQIAHLLGLATTTVQEVLDAHLLQQIEEAA